jgi:CelD/BcsL family acetyltransferase involved in cellulose biosynthesis
MALAIDAPSAEKLSSRKDAQDWTVVLFHDLPAIGETWKRLFETSPDAGPFMSWEYASLWWTHFGAQSKPFVLLATDSDKHQVLLPLRRTGRTLKWLNTPGPDSIGLLYDCPERLPDAVNALGAFLRHERWSKLSASYLPSNQAALFIRALADIPYLADSIGSPYVDICARSWNQYFSALSSSLRKDVRKPLNRLNQNGLSIRFETITSPDMLEQRFLDIDMITASCNMREKQNLLEGKQWPFFLDMLRQYVSRGWLSVDLAYIADKPAAYQIAFTMNDAYSCWRTAYDENLQAYSPGKLLQVHLIERSFNRGDRIFDFMIGLEAYKFQWTDKVQPLTYLVFYRNWLHRQVANLRRKLHTQSAHYPPFEKLQVVMSSLRTVSRNDCNGRT